MSNSPPAGRQPSLPPSVLAAEQRAREFLARAQWRKARDELKPLVKADRARYLPLLIQANIGLVHDMMAKGQVSEAQQVLNYLTTIAPADQLRAVELELASKAGTTDATLPKCMAALAEAGVPLSESERVRLADVLVLTFQPLPAKSPAEEQIALQAQAVHDALLAASQGRWEHATAALRAIPRRSSFSHWILFVKGLAGFHSGETERMQKCFSALPQSSVPAKAAQAYLLLADGSPASRDGRPLPETLVKAVCHLAGAPGAGSLLLLADQAWRRRRHVDSYRVFRDALRSFPSYGLDWLGALSEFYFHAPHAMSEAEQSAYLRYFDGLISRRQLKSGIEEMWARRMFALIDCAIMPAGDLRHDWECFLRQHQALHGENPKLASLAYGWLGGQLAMVRSTPTMFAPRQPQLRDPAGAVEMLQKSIQLDPGNLAAHLQLCAVYDVLKQASERNRLLDDMSVRFPDDKKVLLRAAQGCVERKALVKGLDYLARARQLDPLDPLIPELMVTAQWRLARQYFQQRKAEKARQTLALTREFLTDKPDDLHRSHWTALVREGLMELLWGDAAQSEALLARARAGAARADACLLFAHMAYRVYTNSRQCQSPFWAELRQTVRSAPAIGGIARLLRVLACWQASPEAPQVHDEECLVRDSFKTALRQPFTRAEALEVAESAQDNPMFERQIRALVKKILRDDPLDPRFRLLQLGIGGAWEFNPRSNRTKLQSILTEAVRRRDEATARQARQMLRQLDQPAPSLPDPLEPDIVLQEDDRQDWQDQDHLEGLFPPGLPPEQQAQFREILNLLRNAPESAIRTLRKTRPPGVPEFIFDALLNLARGGPPLPLPPLPSPSASPRVPPEPDPKRSDPNQLNLF